MANIWQPTYLRLHYWWRHVRVGTRSVRLFSILPSFTTVATSIRKYLKWFMPILRAGMWERMLHLSWGGRWKTRGRYLNFLNSLTRFHRFSKTYNLGNHCTSRWWRYSRTWWHFFLIFLTTWFGVSIRRSYRYGTVTGSSIGRAINTSFRWWRLYSRCWVITTSISRGWRRWRRS